ncbi:MAG: DUF92 domain-containing protein [Candidatus Marinimicrobia bacterium]|nr:DUF92 domain-containing protein [Candidatus Neomarinimicrobiota bacterium]
MNFIFGTDWGLFFVFTVGIVAILGLADFLLKKLDVHPHTTRRLVHILVGCLVCVAPFIFGSQYPVLLVALIFTIMNFIAIKMSLLKGIHETDRISYGTVYFPISFFILVCWFWHKDPAILLTAMLIMAFADPIASWVGESRKKPLLFTILTDKKSLQGTSAMFLVSFVVAVLSMKIFRGIFDMPITWITAFTFGFFVAIFAAGAETISHKGTDNLMVPIGAGIILDALYSGTPEFQLHLMIWMGITVVIAYLAHATKALSLSGAMGAWLLGTVVFGLGGTEWMIPIIIFFACSTLLTKLGKKHKKKLETVFEKTGKRDIFQVFANGGVAMIATMCWHFLSSTWPDLEILWYLIFLGAIAAATADTWGTEIGAFSTHKPVSILTWKHVPQGTSGGLTIIGTTGAFVGSFLIAVAGKFSLQYFTDIEMSWTAVWVISVVGLIGALVDSILGATVQAQYQCPTCNKITEKIHHCDNKNIPLVSGYRKITNDLVNLSNTLAGGLLGGLAYLLLF